MRAASGKPCSSEALPHPFPTSRESASTSKRTACAQVLVPAFAWAAGPASSMAHHAHARRLTEAHSTVPLLTVGSGEA